MKIIAQYLRVIAHVFPTRYSEHLNRVECLIYLPNLSLFREGLPLLKRGMRAI